MKVRATLKKICASCKLVRRGRKQFVICAANARHKQRQGFATLAAHAAPLPSGAVAQSYHGSMLLAALPFTSLLAGSSASALGNRSLPAVGASDALSSLASFPLDDDEDL